MAKTRLAKAATVIMLMTLLNKIVGFVRDSLVAGTFGTTYQTDAYNMAMQICDVLFIMIALAITTTFIPILSEILTKNGKEEMFKFANNILNILVCIALFLVVFSYVFAPQIVGIIAPMFRGETYILSIKLTRISVFSLAFLITNAAFTAILQTLDDFLGPAIVGILLNLPIIIYIVLGAKGGVIGLTIVTVLGMALRTLAQIPFLVKHGFKYKLVFDIKDQRVKKIMTLILPVLIGASVNQINKMINNVLGSGLPEGSIAALGFGERVSDVFYSTFAFAIVSVVFPALSKAIHEDNIEDFKVYIVTSINNILLIMVPCTIGIMVLNVPIITLLFKRGIFNDHSVIMTSQVLMLYGLGLSFYSVRDVFNRALYAMQDTKTSTTNGIISVLINIFLNLVLIKFLGLNALPLSSSIAGAFAAFLLFKSLDNKINKINKKPIFFTFIKILTSSIVMGAVINYIYNITSVIKGGNLGVLIGVLVAFTIGVITYTLMLLILKVNEFNMIIKYFKNRFIK